MDDVRWFASNAYTAAVIPELRRLGLRVALEGNTPAHVTLAMSGRVAEAAWHHARAHRTTLAIYLWDLPPHRTSRGKADAIWYLGGKFVRLPRLFGGYLHRAGYYSRLRYVALRADAVWTASDFTRNLVQTRFGVGGSTVPYCYDSTRFRPGTGEHDVPPTLLTVSRLEGYKNQAAVLRAAARIRREVQVRLIGRGPEAPRLRMLGQDLSVRCRIETAADDATVERAYHVAGVVVCPSRFEGMGLGPIEAIASGTPVVVSDIPAHREFVGLAARLVPLDDDVALASAIVAALDGPAPDPRAVAHLTIPAAADRIMASLAPLLR
ncbi:MAG: glycosyltransferase [Gemmatimonadales bacterium]